MHMRAGEGFPLERKDRDAEEPRLDRPGPGEEASEGATKDRKAPRPASDTPEPHPGWYTAESPFPDAGEPVKPAAPRQPDPSGEPDTSGDTPPPAPPPAEPPATDLDRTTRMSPPPSRPTPPPRRPEQARYRPPQRSASSRPAEGRAPGARPRPVPQRTGYVPAQRRVPASRPVRRQPAPARRRFSGCLLRAFTGSILAGVLLAFIAIAVAAVGYVYIGRQLPPANELWSRQTVWVSSRIYDRDGALLWELVDPHGGRRTRVKLDQVSQYVQDATVATEDEAFWEHRGFSPFAIARALYQNLRAREIVSGFSTITQQVARNLLMSPEERSQETYSRKIKEVVLAVEIERRYDKEQILEIYLNENNYGNLAYGIEAAAQTYFQKPASALNLAEASLLAGLPQSPSLHDPFANPDGALARQKDVLRLMVEATQAGHLNPGITQDQADAAAAEMASRIGSLTPPRSDIPAPHFVQYVRQTLEAEFGPDLLYRGSGLRVYTTLDLDLQRVAEEQVRDGVASLADRDVTNGALVAIEPASGEIVAMVGSVDFNDESIGGQVNVALRCRQPGSSIKPLTFLAAFEQGWTPATLVWDVRTEYPNPPNEPYVPRNYDEKYHGNTLVRAALANSYNIPAVKALEYVGVEGLLEISDRLGVVSLRHPEQHCPEYPYDAPPVYGLSLTLGGGETKLLEMTAAYAVLAHEGIRVPPTAIRYIENADGELIADYRERPGGRVVSAQHAYLITDILSDYQARCPAFGCPNNLQLEGRVAAAKTGTTTDYRDSWTIGYTPELVTGVWVGNSDNSPMKNVPGSQGAGLIWNGFMTRALADVPPGEFNRPEGITDIEICADSGTRPSPYCPNTRMEKFVAQQPPPDPSQDLWQVVSIDALSGLRANEYCPDNRVDKVFFAVPPEQEAALDWAVAHGYEQPPEEFCSQGTRPQVQIFSPLHNETVPQGMIPVRGQVQLPNFDRYEMTFGVGSDPQAWGWISGPHLSPVGDGELTVWDTTHLAPGLYTLRVVAFTRDGMSVEARVLVNVVEPAPQETPEGPPRQIDPPRLGPEPTETPQP
jgi:penicillin-binding protein 1C